MFYFFLCELPLILGVGVKLKKKAGDIYRRTLDVEFERDRSIGLGSTIGDGKTNRHTNPHTDVESKIIKKNRSQIFTIAILPSLLIAARK